MILQPQNSFTVVRQIENHLDTDTNYVQAVIRNAYTDAIIATLNLDDKGNQRFSKNWQVPADPSGQGFYISIVTSVYTDSGYTSKNPNYGDQENTYLVQDRLTRHSGGGGSVDAFTVRKIVQEEFDKRAPSFDALYGALGVLQREVNRIPKELCVDRTDELLTAIRALSENIPEKADLAPVLTAVRDVKQAIADKEVTPEPDLSPILDQMSQDKEDDALEMQQLKDELNALELTLIKAIKTNIKDTIDNTAFTSTFETRAQPKPRPATPQPPEDLPFDPSKLGL